MPIDYPKWFELLWRERRRALDACAEVTPEEWRRDLGFSAGSLRKMFEHMVEVERSWMREDVVGAAEPRPGEEELERLYADPRAARARADAVADMTRAVLAEYVPGRLAERRKGTDREWKPAEFSVEEILMHVVTHELRHQGHVQAMLRLLGRPAPNLDWI